MALNEQTAADLRALASTGNVTVVEICRATLDRIAAVEPKVSAFTTVMNDRALARARELDAARQAGAPLGPLFGVPIALKDNLCTRGVRTTAGSRILNSYVPPYSATAVSRLEAAGAVIVGKASCDEFAMGSSTENSAFGPSRNPWDLQRIPGGSSGGSAAAVAARIVPLSLGSDTGGSVRQPAALCGILGMKPTYGRVSRYGLIAFASSLDQIGPFARTARDAALLLGVIAGKDPLDSTSTATPVPDFTAALDLSARGLRIGVPRPILEQGVEADVLARFNDALATLADLGATMVDVELPHARYAIPCYYVLATAEASSNLARYDGVRYGVRADRYTDLAEMYDRTRDAGFGAEVKRRIMLGTYVLSSGYYDAYYLTAQKVRTLIRSDYDTAFKQVDAIAMPTSPTEAFKLGERTANPLSMYLADVFTVSAPLAGLPAISVPCGFGDGRLPVGLQFTGRLFDEATLFQLAHAYEGATTFHAEAPPI